MNNKFLPITVIIPSYNRLEQLKLTLSHYLALPVEQVLLIDDGSTDGTEEEFSKISHEKFLYYKNQNNLGLPGARNKGIELSQTEYVLMGEDDLYMDEAYVRRLFDKLRELKGDFIAGRLINMALGESLKDATKRSLISNNGQFKYPQTLAFDYSCSLNDIIETPYVHACSLYRVEWARRFPYSRRYTGNALREESHFYLNAYKNGAKIFFDSSVSSYHMYHDYGGGCRITQWKYFFYGCLNTHRFLDSYWLDIKDIFEINKSRCFFEMCYSCHLALSSFKHWLSMSFPNLHGRLKSLKKSK